MGKTNKKTGKESRNELIMDLHKGGMSYRDISEIVGMCKSGVHKVVQNMKNNPVIETEDKKEQSGFKGLDYLKGSYDFENQFDNTNYNPANDIEKSNFRTIEITVYDTIEDGSVKNNCKYSAENMSKFEQIGLLTSYIETLKNDILNS